jgi:hypothetical protein
MSPETFHFSVIPERMKGNAPTHSDRAVRDVLCDTYHGSWKGGGGPTAWPPRSPDFNRLHVFILRSLNTCVCVCVCLCMCAASVDIKEALNHRTVHACQTISDCPAISERMRKSMMRLVDGVH